MATYLVTGANRGIGLELVRQLADRGDMVYATCRSVDKMPSVAGDVQVIELDTADSASIASIAHRIETLDVLINNAAINVPFETGIDAFNFDDVVDVCRTNIAGPLVLMQAFADRLRGGKIANISSGLGSIELGGANKHVPYSVSKAGLNMATKLASNDLPDVVVLAISPGWVQTDMGGAGATLTPTESVRSMLRVIDEADASASGTFVNYDGKPLPW
ncbi:MAG: SDR family oxidoreductase [Planctomycetota bacterium]